MVLGKGVAPGWDRGRLPPLSRLCDYPVIAALVHRGTSGSSPDTGRAPASGEGGGPGGAETLLRPVAGWPRQRVVSVNGSPVPAGLLVAGAVSVLTYAHALFPVFLAGLAR